MLLTRDGRDMHLSVFDMLTNGDMQQNLLLKDGDVLHVPDIGNQQVYGRSLGSQFEDELLGPGWVSHCAFLSTLYQATELGENVSNL